MRTSELVNATEFSCAVGGVAAGRRWCWRPPHGCAALNTTSNASPTPKFAVRPRPWNCTLNTPTRPEPVRRRLEWPSPVQTLDQHVRHQVWDEESTGPTRRRHRLQFHRLRVGHADRDLDLRGISWLRPQAWAPLCECATARHATPGPPPWWGRRPYRSRAPYATCPCFSVPAGELRAGLAMVGNRDYGARGTRVDW